MSTSPVRGWVVPVIGVVLLIVIANLMEHGVVGLREVADDFLFDGPSMWDPSEDNAAFQRELSELEQQLAPANEPQAKIAAERWLAAYDRAREFHARQGNQYSEVSYGGTRYYSGHSLFAELIDRLPHPNHWNELARQIDARPVAGTEKELLQARALRLLAHRLTGRDVDVQKELPVWQGNRRFQAEVQTIGREFKPDRVVDELLAEINDAQKDELEHVGRLEVPDLVTRLGEEAARPLLLQALKARAEVRVRGKSVEMARKLARENLKDIKVPHYNLCLALKTSDLFQAFSKLNQPRTVDWSRRNARSWFMADRIIAGDLVVAREALQQAVDDLSLSRDLIAELQAQGQLPRVFEFFLAEDRASDNSLRTIASLLQREADLLAAIEKGIQRHATPELLEARREMLLRLDRSEEALRDDLTLLQAVQRQTEIDISGSVEIVLQVGHLTGRPEWIETALRALEVWQPNGQFMTSTTAADICDFLLAHVPIERAERLLVRWSQLKANDESGYREANTSAAIVALMRLDRRRNRPAAILQRLTQSPTWRSDDLSEIVDQGRHGKYVQLEHARSREIGLLAAWALHEQGKSGDAKKIARRLIELGPGDDRAWEFALQIFAQEFEQLAEEQFQQDQFEERPLIWLAQYHLNRGARDIAEKKARQAVAIDPSDGEQGKGDRLRAYAILSEILQAKGDKLGDIYAGAVRAIRKSELADEFAAANLYVPALRLYRESLNDFADAYCIQSRMAVQLAQQGNFEAAEPYFRRAFELMPDSFGRMESHCFGCEGVFSHGQAKAIAEEVFAKLLQVQPENPRLHYMLGYLREQQARWPEAIRAYRRATELDPEYINAWAQLSSISWDDLPADATTPERQDEIVLNLMRLDPEHRHHSFDSSRVRDLRALWLANRAKPEMKMATNLMPILELTAAKRARKQAANAGFGSHSWHWAMRSDSSRDSVLNRQRTLAAIVLLWHAAAQ